MRHCFRDLWHQPSPSAAPGPAVELGIVAVFAIAALAASLIGTFPHL